MNLSIIIPTLNDAKSIEVLLPRLYKTLAGLLSPSDFEVLVISTHKYERESESVALKYKAKYLSTDEGYGDATLKGIESSTGRYIITIDADFSHSPYVIPSLYASRNLGEIVICSRHIKNGHNHAPWTRKFLSWSLNSLYRFVLDLPIRDFTSGFRLYNRRLFEEIPLQDKKYGILQEILLKAYAEGFKIDEIPFHYFPHKNGSSKKRVMSLGREYLRKLFTYWKLRNSIECADYDERAMNSRHPLQRYWQRKRYEIIMDYSRRYDSILDIGCGSSQIMDGLPQAVGLDIRMNKLRYKRTEYSKLLNGSVFELPFKDNSFTAVIFSQVIEHLPQDPKILDEVVRVTKPGGVCIVGTPDYATHWVTIEKLYQTFHPTGYADEHITHYTLKTLTEELENRNCKYLSHRYVLGAELIMKFRKM